MNIIVFDNKKLRKKIRIVLIKEFSVKILYTIVKKIYNLYNSTKLQNIDN